MHSVAESWLAYCTGQRMQPQEELVVQMLGDPESVLSSDTGALGHLGLVTASLLACLCSTMPLMKRWHMAIGNFFPGRAWRLWETPGKGRGGLSITGGVKERLDRCWLGMI